MGVCADAKVTTMILSVDLDCCPCYRKVKKLLCKFPQIRDQVFDEKNNTVTITVVCCSPEKIRDKLCEKGGKSIKGIAIKEVSDKKPKSDDKPKGGDEQAKEKKDKPKGGDDEKPKEKKDKPKGGDDEKPKEKKDKPKGGDDEKPKEKKDKPKGGDDEKPKENKDKPKGGGDEKPKSKSGDDKPKGSSEPAKQKEAAPAPAAAAAQAWMAEPQAQWIPAYPPGPPPQVYPVGVYYGGPSYCYDGVPVGPPCYQNQQGYGYSYGRPPCPPGYYPNRSDYFSDENPAGCSIM